MTELLEPYVILRRKPIARERVADPAEFRGKFRVRTAFRGSELSLHSAEKKADVALFAGDVEIPATTAALVFADRCFDVGKNHQTEGLDPVVTRLRADVALTVAVQQAFLQFVSNTKTMVHGDRHSGSIMWSESDTLAIDPETVRSGRMGFAIGMLVGVFLIADFSQPAHRGAERAPYQGRILSVIEDTAPGSGPRFATCGGPNEPACCFQPCCSRTRGTTVPRPAAAPLPGPNATRQSPIDACLWKNARHPSQAPSGNISARIATGILITALGVAYVDLARNRWLRSR